MNRIVILCLSWVLLIPNFATSAEPPAPLSAAELSKLAGLEINETLIIGPKSDVQAGKIPLAHTIPETYGKLESPPNVPPFPMPPRSNVELSIFDAELIKTTIGYDQIYSELIQVDQSPRISAPLRPVYVSPEEIELAMKKKKPEKRVRPAKPRKQRK